MLQRMRPRGRPKTSRLPRSEQLRRAKRAQRARQRLANVVEVQFPLPGPVAAKLAAARRAPNFPELLDRALDRLVVRLAHYPQLHDLAWNRVDEYLTAREAFQLYERNWRLIDAGTLEARERELIERLKADLGHDEINA
ncbi:MAG TPA: hypothetical protein VFX89_04375 [Gammaproteobacteria bacterium]|nr:hypothetical protein [Gammaproteobacteria bacterium]